MDKDINMGRALSIGVEDVRPSRDVRSLLIPEFFGFSREEYVKIRNLLSAAIIAAGLTIPSVSSAAYVTAYQNIVYEKDIVDTNSIYNPDKNHFNCVVYTFHSDTDKGHPYIYKFLYDENEIAWKIHADGEWNVVEPKSLAADVLKVCLPYLK